MNNIHACVLGCTNPEGVPYRAAPGQLACHTCADRLRAVLDELGQLYADLTMIDELIPGGHGGDGLRSVPGPRSPAVDAILVHTDVRSRPDGPLLPALAIVEQWTREVREEHAAAVPAGRVSMARELSTLRFHWDWIMGQGWLPDFADEMRRVLHSLRLAGRMTVPTLTIGRCPVVIIAVPLADGGMLDLSCGATLRVRPGDEEIRCRNCGSVWPRSRWRELGDQWIDYARLAAELAVPVGTLRRWCSEDSWRTEGTKRRRLVSRLDAHDSYTRRKGVLPLGEVS